jgi:hypothetical protein
MSVDKRAKGTAVDRRQRRAGAALTVLAILALSLLPLRTLCELEVAHAAQTTGEHQAGGGEDKSDLCCASIDDTALVDSVVAVLPAGPGAAPLVAFFVSSLILSGFVVRRPRLSGASPPSRSYYARSARVLR